MMPSRLLLLSTGLLLTVMFVAMACGTSATATVAPELAPTLEKVSVKLALDWYPNANHAGLFVALKKGYFAEEGLEVNMYTPVDPSTVNQTVAAGADDFGINYQPDLLLARAQGVPVVSIAALVQHPLNSVQTLQSSGLTRPRDSGRQENWLPGNTPERALVGHNAQG